MNSTGLNSRGIKVILFDLGGVLVDLDGPPLKAYWLREVISDEENWRRWGTSPLVEAFESGHIRATEFAQRMIAEQGLQVSVDDFIREFSAWPKGLFAGAGSLLGELRHNYTLACYSNTSELHWSRMMEEMGLASMLDHCYASFELGCYKPALRGFELIVEDLKVKPAEVFFVDDNPANVEAAKKAGLEARQARGLATMKLVMQDFGLIS